MLQDVGLISENDISLVIDKNKLRRERLECRKEIQRQEQENWNLVDSIYIEKRKGVTQVILLDLNGKLHQKV